MNERYNEIETAILEAYYDCENSHDLIELFRELADHCGRLAASIKETYIWHGKIAEHGRDIDDLLSFAKQIIELYLTEESEEPN